MFSLKSLSKGCKHVSVEGKCIVLGRSKLTGIKDRRLSRKHIKLEVVRGGLKLTHIGQNQSVVQDKLASNGFSKLLKAGDTFELLQGKFKYRLTMEAQEMATTSSNHWSQGLVASMNDPEAIVFEDEELCVIKDKYPKSRIHLLVLPKDPGLVNLNSLSARHVPLIRRMASVGRAQVPGDVGNDFRMGFHAVPSMARLHLHVISQDFDSVCLKNKKHWNSFNTDYFVSWDKVVAQLEADGAVTPADTNLTKEWLKQDLKCHKCQYKPKNLPDLKKHIKSHY